MHMIRFLPLKNPLKIRNLHNCMCTALDPCQKESLRLSSEAESGDTRPLPVRFTLLPILCLGLVFLQALELLSSLAFGLIFTLAACGRGWIEPEEPQITCWVELVGRSTELLFVRASNSVPGDAEEEGEEDKELHVFIWPVCIMFLWRVGEGESRVKLPSLSSSNTESGHFSMSLLFLHSFIFSLPSSLDISVRSVKI